MENLTKAESIFLQACDSVCKKNYKNRSVADFRKSLLRDFSAQGLFPTRRIEDWHYTDLKNLLKTFPSSDEDRSNFFKRDFKCLVDESIRLLVGSGNSVYSFLEKKGVKLVPFSQIIANEDAEYLCLDPIDKHDAIGYINSLLVQDGYKLIIPDGCHLDVPIELQAVQYGGQMHLRYPIHFGVGSTSTVIERYISPKDTSSLISSISDIRVCSGAKVVWIIFQDQGVSDIHLGQTRIVLEGGSSLKIFVVNTGEGLVRRELSVAVEGENADFMLRGISLLKGSTHNDLSMFLSHKVPNTSSTAIVRNIVLEKAKGVFQGMIRVSPEAQGSDARMLSNTILLSDKGSFSVKPQLEIFADDVQCGHGATIYDINHDHLYYLMSRGISKSKAYIMLSHAFISEIIEDLNDELLEKHLEEILLSWMNINFRSYEDVL
ncbi:Fe-S cluster assembly protein SufD [Candidatus Liberibacter americanus]|uniref:Iron-sulfur cluster assembly protein SufD n=1 Tax=Candidatus Liberibacter americanus str. Sao Paulo TaxID=1261131 RepID=U6B7Y0_9HYPH|nr:Fe-S cluster assembly protein SufD [Candidatus Liberibacter americanus]AHA27966.1 Iron-sulfur cluster assembly protein SufD [Candidatus Liberibacter americanus str. Sao Paulo]EMS35858.1 putative iron-sulfur cluster assembly protein [Candidatus Liberibacter americanus PW_SP]